MFPENGKQYGYLMIFAEFVAKFAKFPEISETEQITSII